METISSWSPEERANACWLQVRQQPAAAPRITLQDFGGLEIIELGGYPDGADLESAFAWAVAQLKSSGFRVRSSGKIEGVPGTALGLWGTALTGRIYDERTGEITDWAGLVPMMRYRMERDDDPGHIAFGDYLYYSAVDDTYAFVMPWSTNGSNGVDVAYGLQPLRRTGGWRVFPLSD